MTRPYMFRSLTVQAKALRWMLAAALVPPALILLVASVQTVAPMWMLTRDPVSIAELPPYTGFLSNLGVFMWCAAGSTSLFTGAVLRQRMDDSGVYAALAGVYFVSFRHKIWATDYLLLVIALAFLGSSIIVDAFDAKDSELIFMLVGDCYHLIEDGPKLIGIAAWQGYFVRVCWVELLSGRESAPFRHPPLERV